MRRHQLKCQRHVATMPDHHMSDVFLFAWLPQMQPFHSSKKRQRDTVNNLTCGLSGLMMTSGHGVTRVSQTGSSGGCYVFYVWMTNRTTYK